MLRLLVLSIVLVMNVLGLVAQDISRNQYIEKYKGIAIKEMKRTGVPASITLAQGILESNSGNSTLARKANNHFGIKCHDDWNGKTFIHDDDRPNECFRKYKNAELSFKDHSDFLRKHNRYAFLFELRTNDYKSWSIGLKKAGYATEKKYAKLLIEIIESEDLSKYDSKKYKPENKTIEQDVYEDETENDNPDNYIAESVESYSINPFGNDVLTENRISYVYVNEGDTYDDIAERHGVMLWQLLKYNERTRGVQLKPGERLYLQPKRSKADVQFKRHIIAPGENMYIVSQRYGIKLRSLYALNGLKYGEEPELGTTLSLRKKMKTPKK